MKNIYHQWLGFRNIKLKKLVILLVVVEIVVVVGILSVTYTQQFWAANKAGVQMTQNAAIQINTRLQYTYEEVQNTAKQIAYSAFVSKFLTADNSIERRELYDAVQSLLTYTETINSNIQQIVLMDNNGSMISSNGFTYDSGHDIFRMIDVEKLCSPQFLSEYTDGTIRHAQRLNRQMYSYSIPIFSVLAGTSLEKIGSCTFTLRADKLVEAFESTELSSGVTLVLKDSMGTIIYSNVSEGISASDFAYDGKSIKLDDTKYLIQSLQFHPFNWEIVSLIPRGKLSESMRTILVFWALACAIAVLFITIIGAAIIRSITKPVAKIASFISRSQWENDSGRLKLDYTNEIGLLAGNINHMLDTILIANNEIIASNVTLYETQLSQKQSELSALRSQINPHFLYNTLDCIRSISLTHDIPSIAGIAESMSHIFRYSIKGKDMVFVSEELECVEAYMGIMQTRFPDKITFEKDIDLEVLELTIPKMILQPIIENAVYHGLEAKRGKGILQLRAKLIEESVLCFEVTDDGIGMDTKEVEQLNYELDYVSDGFSLDTEHRSIGLRNIIGRIRLIYGKRCGMKVSSEKFVSTTVQLYMEILPRKRDNQK